MGTGAVSGHSTSPHSNQVYPTPATSVALNNDGSSPVPSSSTQPSVPASSAQTCGRASSRIVVSMPNKVVGCETCDISFTFFKRKKVCRDCRRVFCSTCLPKPPSSVRQSGRQCDKCTILTSGKFTRQQLQAWRVKDMRCFLDVRNIPTATCKEKHDLIDLVLLHFCLESSSVLLQQREHDRMVGELADRMRNNSFCAVPTLPHQVPSDDRSSPLTDLDPPLGQSRDPPGSQDHTSSHRLQGDADPQDSLADRRESSVHSTGSPSPHTHTHTANTNNADDILGDPLRQRQLREMREAMQRLQEELDQDEPETRAGNQRASIDDLATAEDADKLTVRQLKEILVNNFVDYRGCCEKHELIDRVKRLWNETQANRQRALQADHHPVGQDGPTPGASDGPQGGDAEQNLCKICMDAPTDCILLECGHMVTCTKCGKRLADCPICRQYITRVVHVFRS